MNIIFHKLSILLSGDPGADCIQWQHGGYSRERRWANRSPLKLQINLCRDGCVVRNTITSDFSISGLFLRCHHVDFRVGNEIPDFSHGFEKWYVTKVLITRIADNGVGVKFYKHDSQTFGCINKLVHFQNLQNVVLGLPDLSSSHAAA